jgi:hypothetical protein
LVYQLAIAVLKINLDTLFVRRDLEKESAEAVSKVDAGWLPYCIPDG